ncbi:FAD dependent oxidoreductase [Lactarius quietus]|nr:FAD dependent oxidoreductase [Lactarius quietus]
MFSRIKLVIALIRQLDGEYRAAKERIDKSPDLPVDGPTTSFWTVPSAQLPIDNDAPLPSHVDVLVIGSGITGVSCTRTLLRHGPPGLRVLVLEARDVCSGATGRNGGHLNGPLFHDYAQLKSEFGLESAKRIIRFRLAHLPALREAVEDISALDYSQVRDVEKLDVYFDQGEFEENLKALEEWKADMPEEAAGFSVFEGKEATERFQLSDLVVGVIASPGGAAHPYRTVTSILKNLLQRYPDQLELFTQTPCTGVTPPSTVTPHYTIQTPRGAVTAHHIIHATNGWTSHLLPGLRGKIFPFRGLMTAQRPGTGLATSASPPGARAYTFYYAPGFDYLTQLPKHSGEPASEGELLFGGGAVQGGRLALSEVGVSDDSAYSMTMASYIQGALPEYFGRANWGAEGVPDPPRGAVVPQAGEADTPPWASGRVMALWTGIMGFSADLQPWVGRVPSAVSGRTVPPSMPMPTHRPLTSASPLEKDAAVRSLAAPGEWVSAGYSGDGMVHAWLCAHALALMLLGIEEEQSLPTWFPDEYRLTKERLKRATLERLMDKL